MSKYVILEHHHQGVHWDFMLQQGDSLRTWRLDQQPVQNQAITATPLAEHRIVYLDYEGPVSGDRGTVRQWDRGEFEWIVDEDCEVSVRLKQGRLEGVASIEAGPDGLWIWTLA